jgi:hypothetical protein
VFSSFCRVYSSRAILRTDYVSQIPDREFATQNATSGQLHTPAHCGACRHVRWCLPLSFLSSHWYALGLHGPSTGHSPPASTFRAKSDPSMASPRLEQTLWLIRKTPERIPELSRLMSTRTPASFLSDELCCFAGIIRLQTGPSTTPVHLH